MFVVLVRCWSFWCSVFFFKQKTAYEMRISDWSSDVCSSDLRPPTGNFFAASMGRPMSISSCATGSVIRMTSCSCLIPVARNRTTNDTEGRHTSIPRSEEHTSELQSLMRISYAVFCLKKQINKNYTTKTLLHMTIIQNYKSK